MSPTATLPPWLAPAIAALQAGDVDRYMAIYAPEPVHEFPFAPAGMPARLEGRAAIAAFMRQLPKSIRFESFSDMHLREAGETVVIEATGHFRRLSDATPWDLGYVWFITRRDGLVTHFRDYMNPLQLAAL